MHVSLKYKSYSSIKLEAALYLFLVPSVHERGDWALRSDDCCHHFTSMLKLFIAAAYDHITPSILNMVSKLDLVKPPTQGI